MQIKTLAKLFPIELPIAKNGKFWNGKPDEFSNIGILDYSQKFGLTHYAKSKNKKGRYIYGTNRDGSPKIHNGHDFSGKGYVELVFPCAAWVTWTGYSPNGYGNYIFFETETKTINGKTVKIQFVLAHAKRIVAKRYKWYGAGEVAAIMGSTGLSTGQHTHNGGRPLIRQSDGSFKWLFPRHRGYIDLTDFYINKPINDKQILINNKNKIMDLSNYNNHLVQLVEDFGGFGIIIDEKLIIGSTAEILATWAMRNDGDTKNKTVAFTKEQWDSVPHYNLKLEKL